MPAKLTGITADGRIAGFEFRRRAAHAGFNAAVEALLVSFTSRGTERLPAPNARVLAIIDKVGLVLRFDGRDMGGDR